MALSPTGRYRINVTGARGGITPELTSALDAAVNSAEQAAGLAQGYAENSEASAAELGNAKLLTEPSALPVLVELIDGVPVQHPARAITADVYGMMTNSATVLYGNANPTIVTWSNGHLAVPPAITGQETRITGLLVDTLVTTTTNSSVMIFLGIPQGGAPTDTSSNIVFNPGSVRLIANIDLSVFPNQTLPGVACRFEGAEDTPILQTGEIAIFAFHNMTVYIDESTDSANSSQRFAGIGTPSGNPQDVINTIATGGTGLFTQGIYNVGVARRLPYRFDLASGPVRVGMGGPSSPVFTGKNGLLADFSVLGPLADAPADIDALQDRVSNNETAIAGLGGNTGPKGDARHIRAYSDSPSVIGSYVAGDNTVTTLTASFSTADLGKTIWANYADGGGLPRGTITAILAGNKVRTSSQWTLSGDGSRVELVWGSDDTNALADLWNGQTLKTAIFRPAPGSFIFTRPFADWRSQGARGLAFTCAGMDAANFFPAPDFDFSNIAGQQYRSMMVMAAAASPFERATFSGFSVWGPLAGYAEKPLNTSVLSMSWNEGLIQNVHCQSFGGLDAVIDCRGGVTVNHVRSKQHGTPFGTRPTTAFRVDGADVKIFDLHVGNAGIGCLIKNVTNAANAGLRCNIVSSLFDECGSGALIFDNSVGKLIGSTAFGGPPEQGQLGTRGLTARNGSDVTMIGSIAEGYGAGEVRNGAQTDSTSKLYVLSRSLVAAGGAGAGIALANAGQTYKDASSTVTGTVTGNAVVTI